MTIRSRSRHVLRTLSMVLPGDAPPSEFKIFDAHKVTTTKGTFIFDEAAIKAVMADYVAHGIDLMIDYDHASLSTSSSPDPAQSGKAAGWFNIEVRDGELWATNVRWTAPAGEALERKEWRFMSPAFQTDADGRIVSLLNVAITNLPATRRLEPLMAANAVTLGERAMLDQETVKKALDALQGGDAEACMGILTEMIASAAAGGEPPPVLEPEIDLAVAAPEEKPEEVVAAASKLVRLSGKGTFVSAVAETEVWRASHLELEEGRQKLAKERETLESAERRALCVKLVTDAKRAPSTVWANSDKGAPPKTYLATMPIEAFREYVGDAIKASAGIRSPAPPPANGGTQGTQDGGLEVTTPHGVVSLSAREVAMCAEKKIDPKDYAARKPVKKG